MGRGRKKGKNKKKTKARGKNNKPVTQNETNGADISAKEDLDALAAEIEATGVSTVKEEEKKEQNTKTKKKRKRNRRRRRKKSGNTDIANGGKSAVPAMATYSDFKKEMVQDEVTVLRSMFVENFVQLPDADLDWQKGCPSFRIAQVKLLDDLMHANFYLMTNWL